MSGTPPRPTAVPGSGASDLPPRGSALSDRDPGVGGARPLTTRFRLAQPWARGSDSLGPPRRISPSGADLVIRGTHGLHRPEQREDSPVLGPHAPGSRDVMPALREPSSGRRHPPSLPTDTRVAMKRPHRDPAPTDTEEAIWRDDSWRIAALLLQHTRRQTPKAGEGAGCLGTWFV
uniref:Uncharacterized protein n=1 Tax=Setaria viridis TaxID=4556 RepID=A0A4U6T3F8_SETVI|nr:LOW QUALITY PROTEIN: hypothetical protein SEVIR_9G298100v2 [Setaria viridis]